jgi:hypothetical protein
MMDEEERREYKAKWARENRRQKRTNVDNNGQTGTESRRSGHIPSASSSASSFLEECKRNIFYAGIDIDREFENAQKWCKRKNRRCTQRFFENWLSKADRLVEVPKPKPVPKAPETPVLSEEELKQKREELGKEVRKLREQFRMQT